MGSTGARGPEKMGAQRGSVIPSGDVGHVLGEARAGGRWASPLGGAGIPTKRRTSRNEATGNVQLIGFSSAAAVVQGSAPLIQYVGSNQNARIPDLSRLPLFRWHIKFFSLVICTNVMNTNMADRQRELCRHVQQHVSPGSITPVL